MHPLTGTKRFSTRLTLESSVCEKMIVLLNPQLASLIDLRTQLKQAHWNVKGRQFQQLHELFDSLADEVDDQADQVAERVTALAGLALGTSRLVSQGSSLKDLPADVVEGLQLVALLADRFATCATAARTAIRTAAEAGDDVTADLFTELTRMLDKQLWMLEAHLQGEV